MVLFCLLFVPITVNAQWVQTNWLDNEYITALATNGNSMFAVIDGGIFRSTNGGQNWTVIDSGIKNINVISIVANDNSIFIGADNGRIFSSMDDGTSWIQRSSVPTKFDVKSIAMSGSNIFVGTNGDGIFLTLDGSNWFSIDNGLGSSNTYVTSLAVSDNSIFASTDCGIYRFTNKLSWNRIEGPPGIVWSVVADSNHIFAGTFNHGIFVSNNDGNSWTAMNTGLINGDIMSLAISNNYILVGTYSEGVWSRLISEMTVSIVNPVFATTKSNIIHKTFSYNILGRKINKQNSHFGWKGDKKVGLKIE